jgi:hypothetical protein
MEAKDTPQAAPPSANTIEPPSSPPPAEHGPEGAHDATVRLLGTGRHETQVLKLKLVELTPFTATVLKYDAELVSSSSRAPLRASARAGRRRDGA